MERSVAAETACVLCRSRTMMIAIRSAARRLFQLPQSCDVQACLLDHNRWGFSMWLAGAGVRGRQAVGATDDLGFEGVAARDHN